MRRSESDSRRMPPIASAPSLAGEKLQRGLRKSVSPRRSVTAEGATPRRHPHDAPLSAHESLELAAPASSWPLRSILDSRPCPAFPDFIQMPLSVSVFGLGYVGC